MARWVERPDHYPGKCALTGYSDALHGPYWEGPVVVHRVDGSGMLARDLRGPVYVSTVGMREVLSAPSSPFVPMTAEVHRSQREMADRVSISEAAHVDALEEANTRIAELESELATLRAEFNRQATVDVDALVERLGDTFARRVGKKPQVSA